MVLVKYQFIKQIVNFWVLTIWKVEVSKMINSQDSTGLGARSR